MAKGDYQKAIQLYKQADTLLNDYAFKEKLAELYFLINDKAMANQTIKVVIDELTRAAAEGEESLNHHADKELAYVYLLVNDYDKALKHALAEYNRRPDNIDVNEAVAWAYHKKGDSKKALPYIQKALRTGSKNPTLLCRAGIIYAKGGEREKALPLLQQGLKNNPFIDVHLKKEAESLLKE